MQMTFCVREGLTSGGQVLSSHLKTQVTRFI